MLDAVLADAESFGATLPQPLGTIRNLTAAHAEALDEVTTVLVHFDLWDGNILVDSSGGRREAMVIPAFAAELGILRDRLA